tara:strand:+ start:1222 stop:2010 length:789 start_codon:yes stop_codon:yes gene_type:complete
MSNARLLVVDSGLGGLSVARAIRQELPFVSMIYAADYAAFPYGNWAESALQDHLFTQISDWIDTHRPDAVVIACNTASTLILPRLRAAFDIPVVGTVPAIKPAASLSRSRLVSVLATPGTVARDYTRALLAEFAADMNVALIGSANLAGLVEQWFISGPSPGLRDAIKAELVPCFQRGPDGRQTDCVVLACTHFPLLKDVLQELAPWQVSWIDSSAAIARQAGHVLGAKANAATPGTFEIISSAPLGAERVGTVWKKLHSEG